MHPRIAAKPWDAATRRRAAALLDFIREHGPSHPRVVEEHFAHGRRTNAWGGSSNATTHLLDGMHYRGLLRVERRQSGVRIYEAVDHVAVDASPEARHARAEALLDLVVAKYAPLPASSFVHLAYLLGYGAPHLRTETRAALAAARARLASAKIDGVTWYWPADENPRSARHRIDDEVRLLAPFDPIAWDRRRFELLWGWSYRFEAYTPAAKRKLGYYALPLLWHERIVGWANASVRDGTLDITTGFAHSPEKSVAFRRAFADERDRLAAFLAL
jgi:hypothetical protein